MILDKNYILETAKALLLTHSPTGYTADVMKLIGHMAEELGFLLSLTHKGNGVITIKGADPSRHAGFCAHVDTLGLMVRSISGSGTLAVTNIGAPIIPTLDGEYCTVVTRHGKAYTGTILSTSPAAHVYSDASSKPRNIDNIEVRLDEVVRGREDAEKLGICAGDYVCIDPKTQITPSGFIKSRFLDDKLSVAILLGALKYLKDNNLTPRMDVSVLISTYEEVGHGMAYIPEGITELIAVDMGCIGSDLSCTEYDVSICAKDSSGPYDYALTSELITLSKRHALKYAVDIYPYYGSDVSAALRAGNDVRGALIGPGVHASHGMERAHWDGVEAATKLSLLYMLEG